MQFKHLGVVGYGEVGRVFAAGLARHVGAVSAWDLHFSDGSARAALAAGVQVCDSFQALYAQADLVVSAVTAANTLDVAEDAGMHIREGSIYLDLNSASPATKKRSAAMLKAGGAHYVDAGVMAAVLPHGMRVPMLLGGPKAEALAETLCGWGLDATAVSDEVGVASAIKMCRSVVDKGLEALVLESYAAARHYGVEEHMLATLTETFPGIDWQQQGSYFFQRVAQHGKSRAEEMFEAARTVRDAGLDPTMATATAHKQDAMARLARARLFAGLQSGARWQDYADRLLGKE
jgi:3-hydroxyisobutyrate dehydrogenase-like beta-hydroxyacid dehydrogenase